MAENRPLTFDERFARLEAAVRKRHGPWRLQAQVGFTRITMDLSLLKKNKVKRTVEDKVIEFGGKTFTEKAISQRVWSLGLGIAGSWIYGNTLEECLAKAEKSYSRWIPGYHLKKLESLIDQEEAREDQANGLCPKCRQLIEHGNPSKRVLPFFRGV